MNQPNEELWVSEPPYRWAFNETVQLIGFEIEEAHDPPHGTCTSIRIGNLEQLVEGSSVPVSMLASPGVALHFDHIEVGVCVELQLHDFDGAIRPLVKQSFQQITCQHCHAIYHTSLESDLFDRTCTACWLAQQDARQKIREKLGTDEFEQIENFALTPENSWVVIAGVAVYYVALLLTRWLGPVVACFSSVLSIYNLIGWKILQKHLPISLAAEALRMMLLRIIAPLLCIVDYRLGFVFFGVEIVAVNVAFLSKRFA